MTPRARRAAGRVRRRIARVDGRCRRRARSRAAHAVARARARRAVPLSLRHAPLHRLQVLRRRLQRAERQPGRDQLAPRRRDRRRLVSRMRTGLVSLDGLQSLRQPDLPERLSGRRLHQGPGHRHRAPQRRRVHRLPVLHLELLVRRPAVQPRARRRRQVRHVPRTPRARPGAGLRERVPGRRHSDRDRQDRRLARRRGGERRWRRACPVDDGSLSTTRVTMPAHLPPDARPVGLTHVTPGTCALVAGDDDRAHAAVGGRVRHDLAAAVVRRDHASGRRGADVAARGGARAERRDASPRTSGVRLPRAEDVAAVLVESRGAAVHRVLRRRRRCTRRCSGWISRAAWSSAG